MPFFNRLLTIEQEQKVVWYYVNTAHTERWIAYHFRISRIMIRHILRNYLMKGLRADGSADLGDTTRG